MIKSNFYIIHQNIRSLRANFNLLLANIAALVIVPQIILLSEVWIELYELENYVIPGFIIFGKCNSTYRAGGVVAYINEDFKNSTVSYIDATSADILQVNFKFNDVLFSVICIYRFHSLNTSIFVDEFNNVLSETKAKNLFIFGDMNINILEHPSSSDEYTFMMASHGLKSLINEPTRIFNNSSTCLDHIFLKHALKFDFNIVANIHNLNITDHCMTSIDIVPCNICYVSSPSSRLNSFISTINYSNLINDLNNECWISVYSQSNASSAYDNFLESLKFYVDKNTSLQEVKAKNRMIKPWISHGLLKKIKLKNRLSKKVFKNSSDIELKKRFKILNKVLRREIDLVKATFYENKFNEVKGNIKQSWKLVDTILNKVKTKDLIEEIIVNDNSSVTDQFK